MVPTIQECLILSEIVTMPMLTLTDMNTMITMRPTMNRFVTEAWEHDWHVLNDDE